MVYDFHTHTMLSDGSLSSMEIVRRAMVQGYQAIALTDHVGLGSLETLIWASTKDCLLAQARWDIIAIPGVELTHLPAQAIDETAKQAKALGARLVVVHGETIMEPVEPGTNLAAIQSPHVDILAHPGFITLAEAKLAAQNGTFLEISARNGHSLTNGHVLRVALQAGANLLVNSDAHDPPDLLTDAFAHSVARGAGLDDRLLQEVLLDNPVLLLRKLDLA